MEDCFLWEGSLWSSGRVQRVILSRKKEQQRQCMVNWLQPSFPVPQQCCGGWFRENQEWIWAQDEGKGERQGLKMWVYSSLSYSDLILINKIYSSKVVFSFSCDGNCWLISVNISTHELLVILSLSCPPGERTNRATLESTWPPARVNLPHLSSRITAVASTGMICVTACMENCRCTAFIKYTFPLQMVPAQIWISVP